jgi:CRP/FNR family transcriptional regulator, cyclic AMP receptor protein
VWQPDDRSDRIYFLLRGRVVISTDTADGDEVVVRVVEEGQPFGELCFCGGPTKYRRTSARAAAECEAVEIKLGDFVDYVRAERDVLAAFLFTLCIRLGEAERRIEVFAYRGAEERLGRLLLHLAASARRVRGARPRPGSDTVSLSVTHEELARMAALSRQRVTTTLGGLRRQGLVQYERRGPLTVHVEHLAAHLAAEVG